MGGMWDHLTPAVLTAAPCTYPRPDVEDKAKAKEPRLHAYPHGSDVALCGKLKARARRPGP
jgi:hypothetical protein